MNGVTPRGTNRLVNVNYTARKNSPYSARNSGGTSFELTTCLNTWRRNSV